MGQSARRISSLPGVWMNITRPIGVVLLLVATLPAQESAPAWSRRKFAAPPAQVFTAALKSIAAQNHTVKHTDETTGEIFFHVGTTAWSWGYNMVLTVSREKDNSSNVSVETTRSGGKAVSWGSGQKEVRKIFDGIDKYLDKSSSPN